MKIGGLQRQIVLSMMTIAFSVTLLILLVSTGFYLVWKIYWPDYFSCENYDDWLPTMPEWGWIIGCTLASLALAAIAAVRLSRRILVPLNSVANSIRRVAQGELDVRAEAGDRSLGEASLLADDFNAMADKLQRMSQEQIFWNAAIAHELRTPVTILRGRLQGLADGVFVADTARFQSLLGHVEGLSRLIEDLRVVSLVESGHLDLQRHTLDLSTDLHAVSEFCADGLQAAGQQLVLSLDNSPVYCDPARIRQALLALLENARRHAVPGEVRICTQLDMQGIYHLIVEDDGPGIAADLAPHIFQAFRRAENTSSGGSGLGLAVVAAIAQAHGGRASYEPTANGGTRFTLSWPAH